MCGKQEIEKNQARNTIPHAPHSSRRNLTFLGCIEKSKHNEEPEYWPWSGQWRESSQSRNRPDEGGKKMHKVKPEKTSG